MTPHRMAERGCRVHVVPSTITFDELEASILTVSSSPTVREIRNRPILK